MMKDFGSPCYVYMNPPACRRVLWIVLVSIARVGFNLRFVSPRGFFDSLTPPPHCR